MEDTIVKSDVNIKKENLDPENNFDHFNTDTVKQEPTGNDTDHLDFNNDNQVKSLTSEATPSATQFFKRSYKISHNPGL